MNIHNLPLIVHAANEYGGWVKICDASRIFPFPFISSLRNRMLRSVIRSFYACISIAYHSERQGEGGGHACFDFYNS